MIDVLLGMAVEGIKSLMQTQVGHNAVHLAAHHVAHSVGKSIERHSAKQHADADAKVKRTASVTKSSRKPESAKPRTKKVKNPIDERIVNVIVEQLGVAPEQVVREARFVDDLGVDSLDAVELVLAFEEEFGNSIPEKDAEQFKTVGDVCDYLHAKGFVE